MSPRAIVQMAVRLGLIASVALSGLAISADDAEARRGGKVRTHSKSSTTSDGSSTRMSDDAENRTVPRRTYTPIPRVRSREAAHGDRDAATVAGGAIFKHGLTGPAAPMAGKDLEVEGCADGMICTVCVAGCSGDAGEIVDAQAKTPVPEPRE